MPDETTLEYQLALESYIAKARSLGLTVPEADRVLADVLRQGDFPPSGTGEIKEAARRLPFAAMGMPLTEAERIAVRHMTEGEVVDILDPQPGDIVLLRISGLVGGLVWLLQALNGDLSKWTHAGVMLPDDQIFEAQPGGAVISPWAKYEGREFDIVQYQQVPANPRGFPHSGDREPLILTHTQRERIVNTAYLYEGSPYNWSTYLYLAAFRVGIRPEWLKRRVQRPDKFICSQAADGIYTESIIHLFNDGRFPCDIAPGDLGRLT